MAISRCQFQRGFRLDTDHDLNPVLVDLDPHKLLAIPEKWTKPSRRYGDRNLPIPTPESRPREMTGVSTAQQASRRGPANDQRLSQPGETVSPMPLRFFQKRGSPDAAQRSVHTAVGFLAVEEPQHPCALAFRPFRDRSIAVGEDDRAVVVAVLV
jgi:hypothetical protein